MSGTDIDVVSILGKDSIRLGFHLFSYIAETVVTTLNTSTYAIVTDTAIAKLYLQDFESALSQEIARQGKQQKSRVISHAVQPGEVTKSRQGKAEVEDFLLREKCTRDTVILALGGGVIGDLTGFVAATFMRGVRYCQIPTTLLAMVDSSVGGKTAIDVAAGKNLIGAFYQPEYIFIDAAFLETLPEREFVNGMAEVIKTAAIWDADSFNDLESGVHQIRSAVLNQATRDTKSGQTRATRSKPQELLLSVIKSSINVKAYIVTKDEKETGLRNLVNFGHTIGHAIEAVLTPHLLHGEAVAVGIALEAEIARYLGILNNASLGRITRCLKAHGLPISLSDPKLAACPNYHEMTTQRLLEIMRLDKKNSGPVKKVVLLSAIGKTFEEKASEVADEIIAYVLSAAMKVFPSTLSADRKVEMATPGSKSISNRALLMASLAQGTCRLTNLLHSDDTQVMIAALQSLQGAKISWEDAGATLVIEGGAGKLSPAKAGEHIYLGNAGTAARFLTSVCTLIASETQQKTVITGNKRMKERPIKPLVDALLSNGADISFLESQGCLPLSIGPTGLKGGRIQLAASISSQYVSSILIAAPYAKEEITLQLVGGQVISQPYIDMTCAMMKTFGVTVERLTDASGTLLNQYRIPRGVYTNPDTYSIESDASSATYPLAIAAITGTTCVIGNIGYESLQGDARFAKDVLEPMGCKVVQTATTTTVTGPPPGQLKSLPEIDMEPMTDAFLTAAALAAVASDGKSNSTRIIGIANQRVKECDRIAAMMTQLARFGIDTKELPTGLQVFGKAPSQLKAGARIHCYDDHRVAMAFSVLAAAPGGPGAVITERRCVEKTWPSWWDDLSRRLGIQVQGTEEYPESVTLEEQRQKHPQASIFLTGMRGAGKTFTGKIGAELLGCTSIDADEFLEAKLGGAVGLRQFVQEHGWPAFRQFELECLKELIETKSINHVIALGGGIVETPEALALLQEFQKTKGYVINIHRDPSQVTAYLEKENKRPAYGEPIQIVFARREPLYRSCSSFDFVSHTGPRASEHVDGPVPMSDQQLRKNRDAVVRFFKFATGRDTNHASFDHMTYFVPLTFPDLTPVLHQIPEILAGADCVEFRVDLLHASGEKPTSPHIPSIDYVGDQLAMLRKETALPVLFTVRTFTQGGMFPDEAHEEYFDLVRAALRWGCEYVDVEAQKDPKMIRDIVKAKGNTIIITSQHDWTGDVKWNSSQMLASYALCDAYGDIIKLVAKAECLEDNLAMMQFRANAASSSKPLITLNMGEPGQLSRILNPVLSPITHPLMAASAPGQLTFAQVQKALHLMGQLPARKFNLFGTPIAQSKSPLMHNTAFDILGLPHTYGLHETAEFDDSCVQVLRSPTFGGASVTIPHKLAVIPHLDELSPVAHLIGAVNTVIPFQKNGKQYLRGENTDWIGIRECILEKAKADHQALNGNGSGLVIGAGGTSRAAIYALHSLRVRKIYLYNRTLDNAQKVASAFPAEYNVHVTDSLDHLDDPPAFIVSTVPASGLSSSAIVNKDAGVVIPDSLLSRPQGGVLVDMAYKPKRTALLAMAEGKSNWSSCAGIEALLYQGFEQFRLWTRRNPPETLVARAVIESYDAEQQA